MAEAGAEAESGTSIRSPGVRGVLVWEPTTSTPAPTVTTTKVKDTFTEGATATPRLGRCISEHRPHPQEQLPQMTLVTLLLHTNILTVIIIITMPSVMGITAVATKEPEVTTKDANQNLVPTPLHPVPRNFQLRNLDWILARSRPLLENPLQTSTARNL